MTFPHVLVSPPFRFDLANRRLWHASDELFLRPKAFAMLHYLLERSGQFVTKQELLEAIWPGTAVSDGAVKACIRELRKVFGDNVRTPKYIETVYRRGYRFIAPLHAPVPGAKFQLQGASPTAHNSLPPPFVGRQDELGLLNDRFSNARAGTRQIVFVTGELGMGKTTLIESFIEGLETPRDVWIARGQCIEQYGRGEAYLPVLTALGRLCREVSSQRLVPLLRQWAPTWLVQLPWLLEDAVRETLQQRLQRSTRARMLREFAEAVEVLTAEQPLILWFDDLQWSDDSTLDLLSFLAMRHDPARLLVVGAYRPDEVAHNGRLVSAVAHELSLHGRCEIFPLDPLTEDAVRHYLMQQAAVVGRLDTSIARLARLIHQRTEGNPLFVANVVADVLSRGDLGDREHTDRIEAGEGQLYANRPKVPQALRQMIEQRLDRLDVESRRVLEIASVAGLEFCAAALAVEDPTDHSMDHLDHLHVEAICAELARRQQFVEVRGSCEWPDGTVTTRYGFLHALYQDVLYERLPAGKRRRLHQHIAERQEQGYGAHAPEIAAELAMHFEHGREPSRAFLYRQHAADAAVRRYAYREAIAHLTQADTLLRKLPATPERNQYELRLLLQFIEPITNLKGEAAPDLVRLYTRALELSDQGNELATHCRVLLGLGTVYLVRGEILTAQSYGQQAMALAEQIPEPSFAVFAHQVLGMISLYQGHLDVALTHFEKGLSLADMADTQNLPLPLAMTKVFCLFYSGLVLWAIGYPKQATERGQAALAVADQLGVPYSRAFALYGAALLHVLLQEREIVCTYVEEMIALCEKYGLQELSALGAIMNGWIMVDRGQAVQGIAQIQRGLAAYQATGAELSLPHLLALLVEAYVKTGQVNEGLRVLTEAIDVMQRHGEQIFASWLFRLKGELILLLSPEQQVEAEQCFLDAIDAAQHSHAKSWELQATICLAQLWYQQGKRKNARQVLTAMYGWFSEGKDGADLRAVQDLLSA